MKTKIFFFASAFLCPFVSFASVDVEANLPSGTYHTPVSIKLSVNDPAAKTFYSFKPDGTPQDAYLYTGALFLKKSTPIVFFSIVDYDNESKIKQNDYLIEYPSEVHFLDQEKTIDAGANRVKLILVNDGSESVDVGYWQVQSEAELFEFPTGTILAPGERKEVSLAYTGSSAVTLRSPDGDERAVMTVDRSSANERQTNSVLSKVSKKTSFARFDEAKWKPIVQKLATPSTSTGASVAADSGIALSTGSVTTPVVPSISMEETGTNIQTSPNVASSIIPTNNIKSSVSESGVAQNPLYIFGILGVLFGLGVIQFIIKRKT